MLLFRSEEHVARWTESHGMPRGETMSLEQQWTLARKWYGARLQPGWRRLTPDEAHAAFESCGLTGAFWRLT
jgi:hypothetical protein